MAFSPCSDLYFVQPVLSGHPVLSGLLAIPQGWPFNTGSTVECMPTTCLYILFRMKLILFISSNCVLTDIYVSAAVTLLEQRPEGLTRIRPLSCGFDSSVGRALHWHRRGRGFESRSEPEFFSGLCSSSVTAALALMTVIVQIVKYSPPSLRITLNFEQYLKDKRTEY